MNLKEIRSLFPVTKDVIYLNTASQAPLNSLVYDSLQTQLLTELNPLGKKEFNRDTIRVLLAKLLGGSPDEYALTSSTGAGIGMIAQGIDFKAGDNIIVPEREHWNNTFPWMNLEKKGVEIRYIKLNADNSFHPEAIEKLIDNKTRVVDMAAVRYNSGFRPNLSAIGKIAHKHSALFLVDAAQAAGVIPIDVEKEGIDVMCGCGFKWLLGMYGTGYLYVSKRVVNNISPVLPGMFAAEHNYKQLSFHNDSRKFETGTIAYALFNAWTAGLQLLIDIGVETIYEKAMENTDLIIKGLQEKNYNIITPISKRGERSAIVHFNTSNFESTKILFEKLKEKKVLLTLQGENIRMSPNFYNTKEEIELFLDLL